MEKANFDDAPHTRISTLRLALGWPVAKRSLMVMVVVGSILNVINQGDVMLAGGAVNWWKVALTYCVPFCVATYGAFCAFRALGSQSSVSMQPVGDQVGNADDRTVPSRPGWCKKDDRR